MTERGFSARVVVSPARPPFVRVVNLAASQLREDITCGLAGGELFFHWSWGGQIAPARHLEPAAARVAFVLAP